jgi:hypothetical protein
VNTTKFAEILVMKKTTEKGNMALGHAGVRKKNKFKEGRCLKNTNTISWR